jgi:very-short-patch-repair endonuclease
MHPYTLKSRNLRHQTTPEEIRLWRVLKDHGLFPYHFRRQHPIPPYIVDFYSKSLKLVIELDGGQHNDSQRHLHDQRRTDFLKIQGITVLRFWNNDITTNIDGVILEIQMTITKLASK